MICGQQAQRHDGTVRTAGDIEPSSQVICAALHDLEAIAAVPRFRSATTVIADSQAGVIGAAIDPDKGGAGMLCRIHHRLLHQPKNVLQVHGAHPRCGWQIGDVALHNNAERPDLPSQLRKEAGYAFGQFTLVSIHSREREPQFTHRVMEHLIDLLQGARARAAHGYGRDQMVAHTIVQFAHQLFALSLQQNALFTPMLIGQGFIYPDFCQSQFFGNPHIGAFHGPYRRDGAPQQAERNCQQQAIGNRYARANIDSFTVETGYELVVHHCQTKRARDQQEHIVQIRRMNG